MIGFKVVVSETTQGILLLDFGRLHRRGLMFSLSFHRARELEKCPHLSLSRGTRQGARGRARVKEDLGGFGVVVVCKRRRACDFAVPFAFEAEFDGN